MTSLNKVFADLPVTIFEAMSQAARDNNAINLGQGFPDDPGPADIRKAAVNGQPLFDPNAGDHITWDVRGNVANWHCVLELKRSEAL